MILTSDYIKRIKEARELTDRVREERAKEIEDLNSTAELYLDELIAGGIGNPGDERAMDYGPRKKLEERAEMHGTAETIITLSDIDGMSADFLFAQPAHAVASFIEDVVEEV